MQRNNKGDMKATEIQIGDRLFYKGRFNAFDFRVEQVTKRKVGYHAEPGEHRMYYLRLREVQPIPLTSDLLERHGFKKVPQPGCANPYHWMLEKYEEESDGLLYRIKAFNTPFRGMFVSIDNPSDCETISFGKQIEFVHEFQHALRLCDIDTEIIINED